MFSKAETILSHYTERPSRFDIHSITAHRGQNPEDIFYVCHVKNIRLLVYETDYISELSYVVTEAEEVLAPYNAQLKHWLVKKDADVSSRTLSTDIPDNDKTLRRALILDLPGTYLRYAVLELQRNQDKSE